MKFDEAKMNISYVFFSVYCEVSNIHHPLWSCQIEVRSKGILVVSLIAFVMCERVDENGHALTYTIVHEKKRKQNWANYPKSSRYKAWSNEQIFPYECYSVCVCRLPIHSSKRSRENAHHYLFARDVLVDTLKLITTSNDWQ